jgi:superfamily II DNA helicase RecQ
LRSWRREKAGELGNLPAYVVYTDRTLKELAARMPETQADLLEVPGIGPAKARQYGAETLAVIRRLSGKDG